MENILQYLSAITSLATLIGIVVIVYKFSNDPDEKASKRISLLEQGCELKHKFLDENILMIKENHLKHIEADIRELKEGQIKVMTILEERLPK